MRTALYPCWRGRTERILASSAVVRNTPPKSNADRLCVACFEPMAMAQAAKQAGRPWRTRHFEKIRKAKIGKSCALTGDWRDTPAEGTVPLVPLFVAL